FLSNRNVKCDVDQTPRQIARVGCLQRRVDQSLPAAVCGDEVLEHGQALAEVGLDREVQHAARRAHHQATHGGHLAHLAHFLPRAHELAIMLILLRGSKFSFIALVKRRVASSQIRVTSTSFSSSVMMRFLRLLQMSSATRWASSRIVTFSAGTTISLALTVTP